MYCGNLTRLLIILTFTPLPCSRLCNGLSSTSRSPGACVPLSCVRALFPLLYSWGGCDFPPGQRSLRGQDCQDLPCGEHDGHHAWLSGGGQWQSGPGPGTWCSEPTPTATEPGQHHHSIPSFKIRPSHTVFYTPTMFSPFYTECFWYFLPIDCHFHPIPSCICLECLCITLPLLQ